MAHDSVHGRDSSGVDESVDVDSDAGFSDLSSAGAEQVTCRSGR